jgi:hypothetical protein
LQTLLPRNNAAPTSFDVSKLGPELPPVRLSWAPVFAPGFVDNIVAAAQVDTRVDASVDHDDGRESVPWSRSKSLQGADFILFPLRSSLPLVTGHNELLSQIKRDHALRMARMDRQLEYIRTYLDLVEARAASARQPVVAPESPSVEMPAARPDSCLDPFHFDLDFDKPAARPDPCLDPYLLEAGVVAVSSSAPVASVTPPAATETDYFTSRPISTAVTTTPALSPSNTLSTRDSFDSSDSDKSSPVSRRDKPYYLPRFSSPKRRLNLVPQADEDKTTIAITTPPSLKKLVRREGWTYT